MLRRTIINAWKRESRPNHDHPFQFGGPERFLEKDLLVNTFGWGKGELPKFRARSPFHRETLIRRMATELVRKDHVIVAGARGPSLRVVGDQLVKLAKRGDTESRQKMANFLNDPLMVDKAFDEFPRRFADSHDHFTMMTKLRSRRRIDGVQMYFIEFKNRDMSDMHKGEDYSSLPERFFLPPRVVETERGVQRPPHLQMAFDRWASKFKTEEFHFWWKQRHAKMRYWGIRNVPHPADVDPLWSEKEEEDWHNEMLSNTDVDELDLDDEEEAAAVGEGGGASSRV